LPWAVVSFSDAEQQHATAIFYRGPSGRLRAT
jgi:hypothetical protein